MKRFLKAVWQFCSYLFVPKWGKRPKDYGQDGYLEEPLAKRREPEIIVFVAFIEYYGCANEDDFEIDSCMTQDERWLANWKSVMDFMEANHRRPSNFIDEERGLRNWWKNQQKLLNAGEMKGERVKKFRELLAFGKVYKHVN